ncbi:MAG: putative bifunctional diguanylate cyclase/phosphodiesterase [Actinomycetota bacterium]
MREHEPGSSVTSLGSARLFAAAPEALFVVRDHRIELANEATLAFLGADPLGLDVREVIPDWVEGADAGVPFEATLRSPSGRELAGEVRVRRLDAAASIVAIRDARALVAGREAETALTEAEARYRSLVEQIPAVVYADDGNVTTYVSPQIEQILGVAADAYRGNPDMWLRMVHPDDREQVQAESEAFLAGEGGDLSDYRMVRPDGRVVWVRDRAYARRDADGQVIWEHGLLFDVTELKDAEARVAEMAFHDGLTGLANRELFEETLVLAVERARRNQTFAAVLYFDLDNFKLVNDSLGHHAGDTLLKEIAERLHGCTRDTDLVARQGGDEFLILVADLDPDLVDDAIRAVADRVTEAMRTPFDLHDVEFHARGSMGISVYPRDASDTVELLKNADIAMYRAKRLEPGGALFFAADADDAMERLSFASRLREAVASEQWMLHYQPVVDLSDRRIVGAEALIRWRDASGGIVPPGDFIPVAEELGLIEAIGEWVVDEVGRQQRSWREAGLELQLSFNLSPRQLWTPRLAERLVERLRNAGVDPSTLMAEITESSAMADPDRTQRVLRDLHAWGLGLAIDDFGTGYSSLARLKHMPVDVLKIDREFVRDVDRDVRLAGMVRAMIQVAQSLDMIPLAEGIETEGEYIFLRSNGCRLAQGFWFAHPMPPEELFRLAMRGEGLGDPTHEGHAAAIEGRLGRPVV